MASKRTTSKAVKSTKANGSKQAKVAGRFDRPSFIVQTLLKRGPMNDKALAALLVKRDPTLATPVLSRGKPVQHPTVYRTQSAAYRAREAGLIVKQDDGKWAAVKQS